MEMTYYHVLSIVEWLRQEANSLVTKRFQFGDLFEREARHNRASSLPGMLEGGKPEGLITHDRSSKRSPKLLPVEGGFEDILLFEQVRICPGEQRRCVLVEPVISEETEDGALD